MRKVIVAVVIACLVFMSGCASNPAKFFDKNPQYVIVDNASVGMEDYDGIVCVSRVSGAVYIFDGKEVKPLFYSDGTPMIYDECE